MASARACARRSGCSTATIWQSAPPVSLPTSVTRSSSSSSMNAAISPARAGGERSLAGSSARTCEPSGQSGAITRKSAARLRRDLPPQLAVGEQAMDEQDRLAAAAVAIVDRSLGQGDVLHRRLLVVGVEGDALGGRPARVGPPLGVRNPACAVIHTDCMYVAYSLYACQGGRSRRAARGGGGDARAGRGPRRRALGEGRALAGDAGGARADCARPVRRARIRRRGHRGDRARRRRHPGRPLSPLRRQARAVRRGLRAGRAGADGSGSRRRSIARPRTRCRRSRSA